MPCSTDIASYFATTLHNNKECTARSLVKALDTFLIEVQEMRDVIMVPNRLRGVPMPKITKQTPAGENGYQKLPKAASPNGIANTMALLPVGSRALLPYGVNDGFIATEGYLRDEMEKRRNRLIQPKQGGDQERDFTWPEDLFRRYRVVQALRKELITDRSTTSSSSVCEDDENLDDEQTRILVARFRQYLGGLYDILDQLTDMAQFLSKWYQDEVDPNADRSS